MRPPAVSSSTQPPSKHAAPATEHTMTNAAATRPKQRTKAGCLICRQKRKKCDEKLPVCDRCQRSGSKCQWPSSADLVDRRFASHSEFRFRHRKSPHLDQPDPAFVASKPALSLEASATHKLISRDIEEAVSRHFDSEYVMLIMPPGGHISFFDDWAVEIHQMKASFKAFQYAALACSASHLHYKSVSSQMQELALTYYCSALRQLAHLLASNSAALEHHNGVIMCILTLCMHGSTGRGTTSDMERHVEAVTKLLSLRIQSEPSVIGRPFDRLGVECALHQMFLVGQGLWSDKDKSAPSMYLKFWGFAEGLLDQSNLYLHKSEGFRTPIVGIPSSLLRIAMVLRQQWRRPWQVDQLALDGVRPWIVFWERKSDELAQPEWAAGVEQTMAEIIREDTSHLYALIVSLLFEQLMQGYLGHSGLPRPVSGDKWQVQRAMTIIQRHWSDDRWSCYSMCDWPMYTLGVLVSASEDVERVRWDLQRRWELSKFGHTMRLWTDLEAIWSARISPQSSPSEIPALTEDQECYSSATSAGSYSPPAQSTNELTVRLRNPTPQTSTPPASAMCVQHHPSSIQLDGAGATAVGTCVNT